MGETYQVPRKERLHVHKVSDCARFFPCKLFRHGTMSPFLQRNEIGTSKLEPISQLNTWPVVSPVNASRRPSRDDAHHSGSGRLAIPYPVKDSHLLFFASFAWRTPSRVKMRRTRIEHMSAGLPLITDIALRGWDGRRVPKAAVERRSVACSLISRNIRLRRYHTGRDSACLARRYPRSRTG